MKLFEVFGLKTSYLFKVTLIVSSFAIIWTYCFLMVSLLPSAIRVNQEINLSNKFIANYLNEGSITIHQGWAPSESWGMWALGNHAVLSVLLPYNPRPKFLVLKIRPLISNSLKMQVFYISLDKKLIKRFEINKDETIFISLQSEDFSLKDNLQIDFYLKSNSPKELGLNEDERLLSIGLMSIGFH